LLSLHTAFHPTNFPALHSTTQQRLCEKAAADEAIQYFCCHCCWITTTLRSRDDDVENIFAKRHNHPGLLQLTADRFLSSLQASLPQPLSAVFFPTMSVAVHQDSMSWQGEPG